MKIFKSVYAYFPYEKKYQICFKPYLLLSNSFVLIFFVIKKSTVIQDALFVNFVLCNNYKLYTKNINYIKSIMKCGCGL